MNLFINLKIFFEKTFYQIFIMLENSNKTLIDLTLALQFKITLLQFLRQDSFFKSLLLVLCPLSILS